MRLPFPLPRVVAGLGLPAALLLAAPAAGAAAQVKLLAKGCGLGVYTKDSEQGFGVDFDSLSYDHCPKGMVRGVVDLAVPATTCADARWEGTPGGACAISTAGDVVVSGRGGDQWDVTGTTAASLCGAHARLYGFTADGTAWEQAMPVFDGAEVCGAAPPPAPECDNGVDDDGDGQVDVGGGAGGRADPGCDTTADPREDSEIAGMPAGCAAIIAFDPAGDLRAAYPMVLPYDGEACPTVKAAWAEVTGIAITACEQAYFGGVPGGACTLVAGGLTSSGAAGARWGADVRLGADASCAMTGRIAIRLESGAVREAPALPAVVTEAGLGLCP